jgi:hypothetical protein
MNFMSNYKIALICLLALLTVGLMAACDGLDAPVNNQPAPTPHVPAVPPVAAVAEADEVMRGICFEAALDAAGTVFVIRDDGELARFYDLADNSGLCRRPVERRPFDFSEGRLLAGLWSMGRGCTAQHEVIEILRDDEARALLIHVEFVTEGACNYELVRPFWLALEGVGDYEILIVVIE